MPSALENNPNPNSTLPASVEFVAPEKETQGEISIFSKLPEVTEWAKIFEKSLPMDLQKFRGILDLKIFPNSSPDCFLKLLGILRGYINKNPAHYTWLSNELATLPSVLISPPPPADPHLSLTDSEQIKNFHINSGEFFLVGTLQEIQQASTNPKKYTFFLSKERIASVIYDLKNNNEIISAIQQLDSPERTEYLEKCATHLFLKTLAEGSENNFLKDVLNGNDIIPLEFINRVCYENSYLFSDIWAPKDSPNFPLNSDKSGLSDSAETELSESCLNNFFNPQETLALLCGLNFKLLDSLSASLKTQLEKENRKINELNDFKKKNQTQLNQPNSSELTPSPDENSLLVDDMPSQSEADDEVDDETSDQPVDLQEEKEPTYFSKTLSQMLTSNQFAGDESDGDNSAELNEASLTNKALIKDLEAANIQIDDLMEQLPSPDPDPPIKPSPFLSAPGATQHPPGGESSPPQQRAPLKPKIQNGIDAGLCALNPTHSLNPANVNLSEKDLLIMLANCTFIKFEFLKSLMPYYIFHRIKPPVKLPEFPPEE